MKLLVCFLCMFMRLFSMNPLTGDITTDLELYALENIFSTLKTTIEEFNTIQQEREALKIFKEIMLQYKSINDNPIWIADLFDEPEKEPPGENQDLIEENK